MTATAEKLQTSSERLAELRATLDELQDRREKLAASHLSKLEEVEHVSDFVSNRVAEMGRAEQVALRTTGALPKGAPVDLELQDARQQLPERRREAATISSALGSTDKQLNATRASIAEAESVCLREDAQANLDSSREQLLKATALHYLNVKRAMSNPATDPAHVGTQAINRALSERKFQPFVDAEDKKIRERVL